MSERTDLDLPAADQVRAGGYDPWYDRDERLFHVILGKHNMAPPDTVLTAPPDTVLTAIVPVLNSKVSI